MNNYTYKSNVFIMDNSQRVATSPNACKIGLYFSADVVPSVIDDLSPFYTSELASGSEDNLYVTSGSIKVTENGTSVKGNFSYDQTITFALPSTDALRAQRIDQFKKVKFISIQLTNGAKLFFGRNDVKQNTPPKVKVASSEKLTQVQFKQKSIFPLGFLTQSNFLFQDEIVFIFQDGPEFNL